MIAFFNNLSEVKLTLPPHDIQFIITLTKINKIKSSHLKVFYGFAL